MNVFLALTYTFLSACFPPLIESNQEYKCEITANTTKEELETIKKEVKDAHAELIIHRAEYKNDKLSLIKLTLVNPIGEVNYFNDDVKTEAPICLSVSKNTVAVGCCNQTQN